MKEREKYTRTREAWKTRYAREECLLSLTHAFLFCPLFYLSPKLQTTRIIFGSEKPQPEVPQCSLRSCLLPLCFSISVTSSLSDVSSSTPALQVVAYSTRADITLMANVTPTTSISASTTATTPKSGAGTEFWEKAIDLVSPLGTFIIAVVSLGLLLILLIALIVVCCKYKRLKEKTGFPDHMAISDSEWMRSNNDLMMWERNLRASEVHIDDS
ncbi:PREDICTED: uncharacterized protein LOC107337518 isoform X2 [Acropora digitifera]|uniref:uncharacterized protein LOC107337518 isoform X2 n=1 Tax=Acropora digitifera TaxID=70779 RepID=UPI00077A097C|nr:PREDICTED: uncharacterized protein LOC107337518 isoform X2 [Acropora digitifera]